MTDDPFILQIVERAAHLLSLSCAMVVKGLMYSVLLLAAGSITLGELFFLRASPYAGAVEISAGDGLVTAPPLITALSLTWGEVDRSRVYL